MLTHLDSVSVGMEPVAVAAQSFEGEPQDAKVPHLRNAYAKIGMFSVPGPQGRGFGFLHDGSIDTVKNFIGASVFSLSPTQEDRVEQFVLAFPSDLAPIGGQLLLIGALLAAGAAIL